MFINKKPNIVIENSNIKKLHNHNIKFIHNVYQPTYIDNKKPTGFGDFIRGCYFLLEFCKNYGFQPNINIHHPIAMFFQRFAPNYNSELKKEVALFNGNNLQNVEYYKNNSINQFIYNKSTIHEFIFYLNNLKKHNNSLFIYTILFPYKPILHECKIYMRQILEPTEEMKQYIQTTLNQCNLIKNNYLVIHVRCGDEYLIQNKQNINANYLKKITDEISLLFQLSSILKKTHVPFLLLSDSILVKNHVIQNFPTMKTLFHNIIHIGEGNVKERDEIKNTLLEFYLMSFSTTIYSFTCYQHGSGFSYWCAQTYDIPYNCKFIKT